jgi:tetratricopeptide (TPR) repeat protein
MSRLGPEQLVRVGNAAYGAGLVLLMLGRRDEAREWLGRAAARWRESWEQATPTSWGRPIGLIKAALIAGRSEAVAEAARWTLSLESRDAESPIGRYAAALALLAAGQWADAAGVAATLHDVDDFPDEVARALAAIAAADPPAYDAAIEEVLESFEDRDEYLEEVPVGDTVLALQALAEQRGIASPLRRSPVLPG